MSEHRQTISESPKLENVPSKGLEMFPEWSVQRLGLAVVSAVLVLEDEYAC